jgi:hypothetical protein
MDKLVDDLAHLGELDDLSDLLGAHLIEVGPCELFLLLDFPQDLLRDAMVLTKGRHRCPLSPLHHLADVEEVLTHLRPPPLDAYLKETPKDATSTLSHINHVGI